MSAEVTASSQLDEALQMRQQLHEALFEYNPSQTIAVDDEGRIITYNKAKRESGDRLPNGGDVMFKDYAGRYDMDMHSEMMECIRTGQTRVFEAQKYVDKILSTTIAPFPGGAIIITEDVTDDKNAIEFDKALFEYNPSQTIVVDSEGRIITYNKAKRESDDRLPTSGDVMFRDYAGRYDIDMHSELTRCIQTGETGVYPEQKYMDKILSTTISPFPGGAIIITEDVTAQAQAQKELTKANEELKERDRLQTTFVSNVSHELRTALCIFRNTMSNVAASSKGKLDKKLSENLRMADDSIGRLWQIIDDFVELSEIEMGNVKLSCNRFDLGEVVSSVVDSMKPRAKARNIKLKAKTKTDAMSICGDHDKIRHVLMHLVDNAVKFVPDGGKVWISMQDSDDEVAVAVEDNGLGIESDKLEKIFGCFTKFGAAHSGSMAGVGLGLTLARQLVEMHGGRIWAQSTVGQGSTFHFVIPKKK
jgi:signal transduction histidine kinase